MEEVIEQEIDKVDQWFEEHKKDLLGQHYPFQVIVHGETVTFNSDEDVKVWKAKMSTKLASNSHNKLKKFWHGINYNAGPKALERHLKLTRRLRKIRITKRQHHSFDEIWGDFYTCPACKEKAILHPTYKFCPECGVELSWSRSIVNQKENK